MTTRLSVVRQILQERKLAGEPGFDLRGLSNELEYRIGKMCLEDTARKLADILKPEIPFVKAGKGCRKFIFPEQGQLWRGV